MKAVFRFLWGAIRVFNNLAALLLFALLLMMIVGVSSDQAQKPASVPKGGALILDFGGYVVEKIGEPDPRDLLSGNPPEKEILLRDLLKALEHAKDDERIAGLVLALDGYRGAMPASMHAIGAAIASFRESGKKVIAYAGDYGQAQYYLATQADEIWLDPEGSALLTGYGAFTNFFAEGLGKLKAKVHVYKVGTYKSAVEPYIRNDMSDAAKEANLGFLSVLWDRFKADVETRRGFESGRIEADIAAAADLVEAAGGNLAALALERGYVDALKTHVEARKALAETFGETKDDQGFKGISFMAYLDDVNGKDDEGKGKVRIAVITLRGPIVDGSAGPDSIGANNAIRLLDAARKNDKIKAVVLRIDSPGGSAFASEQIRQSILELKAAGKPVIASMGSVAASGGYWISASTDEIWAAPETITGSIGIFGLFLTFEDTLGMAGIHRDGIGTTPLAGALDPLRPMNETVGRIIQASIEEGYRQFLTLVAEGRGMTTEEVDAIAQGRVWAGATAHELGLVDDLGDLDDAIAAAARRAGLEEGAYDVGYLEEKRSPFEQLLLDLMQQLDSHIPLRDSHLGTSGPLGLLETQIRAASDALAMLNDPRGAYALCLPCAASIR
ncbi:MAG: signal peptide peptidase SppA [Rhodothalassiaceae bacterium]